QPPLQLAPQNPVFSSQILVPQQQLMVHRPRNVGQDTCPLHESPPHLSADPQRAPLIASKKCSGRHAARLCRDGITARLSCSFNVLATRESAANFALAKQCETSARGCSCKLYVSACKIVETWSRSRQDAPAFPRHPHRGSAGPG